MKLFINKEVERLERGLKNNLKRWFEEVKKI